jgi:hypothetical protein
MRAYHANRSGANEAAALEAADIAEKAEKLAVLIWDLAHPKMKRPGKDGIPTTRPRMTYANVYPDGTLTNLPYNPNLTYYWPCGITSDVPYEYEHSSGAAETCPGSMSSEVEHSFPPWWANSFHF